MKLIIVMLFVIAGYFALSLTDITNKNYTQQVNFAEQVSLNSINHNNIKDNKQNELKNVVSETKEVKLDDNQKGKIKPILLIMKTISIIAVFTGLAFIVIKIKENF